MLEVRCARESESNRTKSRPYWSHLRLIVLAIFVASCAEAPGSELLDFEQEDSAIQLPPVMDTGLPPAQPGGNVDPGVPIIPPIIVPDASTPPPMDAGVTPPKMDAGGNQPPVTTPDAARPPVDAAPDVSAPPPPRDSGPEASTPPPANTCATTPGYPTPDACSKCICMKCSAQVAACYGGSDATQNQQCKSVRDCATTNHCTGEACYCGTSPTCLFADGPCMNAIQTAAGTTDLLEIRAAGIAPGVVLTDCVYGADLSLRRGISALALAYAVGVRARTLVAQATDDGTAMTAIDLAKACRSGPGAPSAGATAPMRGSSRASRASGCAPPARARPRRSPRSG